MYVVQVGGFEVARVLVARVVTLNTITVPLSDDETLLSDEAGVKVFSLFQLYQYQEHQ